MRMKPLWTPTETGLTEHVCYDFVYMPCAFHKSFPLFTQAVLCMPVLTFWFCLHCNHVTSYCKSKSSILPFLLAWPNNHITPGPFAVILAYTICRTTHPGNTDYFSLDKTNNLLDGNSNPLQTRDNNRPNLSDPFRKFTGHCFIHHTSAYSCFLSIERPSTIKQSANQLWSN